MTDPLIYACLQELRDRMLIIRSDSGVKIVEETIKEIERLNKELESKDLKIKRYKERLFENYEH